MPNFVEITLTVADIYGDFSNFQDGGRRHVGFLKFQIFNGRNGQECGTASVCQILPKSMEPRPRYVTFNIMLVWLENAYSRPFLDRPFCERSILCLSHVSFLFFSQLTFSDVCKPIFSKLFHMTWLYSKKKRCYTDFLKVPPNKNDGRKTPNYEKNAAILLNHYISAAVRAISTKFGMVMQFDPPDRFER